MRVLIVAVLVALTVNVGGQRCINTADCVSQGVTCGGGSRVVCLDHWCKCAMPLPGYTCTDVSDCPCDHGHPHCIDGHCRCTIF